ncbi:DUF2290 domain-containing protein [Vibrio aestuarianus subsp. cardii]|uniref:DUF2290 domain-containing protein n=1 Tax=Vibrio aestuarianus TaxID=28171 RepID=UPI0015597215|nr:DUF2290 domain-containing protein [Vibrio aestuarianus]NGZ69231.1 DUF2290 domain-containing protein [Vibrio aestuarianus subsp. cardii]
MAMTFTQSIIATINLADDLGMLFQAGAANSLNVSYEVKKITRNAVSYREVYDAISTQQEFNLMLSDQSVFQFTENKAQEDIRLVYYPSPYQFVEYQSLKREAIELLNSQELTEVEFEQYITEAEFTCDIPVIRYDLSLGQHCELYHPAAHFHIGFFAENRWSVNRVLTPYSFFMTILLNYYPKIWASEKNHSEEPKSNRLDVFYRKELKQNCPKISEIRPKYFVEIESARLHFR